MKSIDVLIPLTYRYHRCRSTDKPTVSHFEPMHHFLSNTPNVSGSIMLWLSVVVQCS